MSYVERTEIRDHLATLVAHDGGRDGGPLPPLLKPYVWRPSSEIPRREWLYDHHYIRSFTSATFAPGGVGKSMLDLLEAVAMASGKPLAGVWPTERLRVGYFNGEDPPEETQRRLSAIEIQYGLKPEDLEGWLFVGSGREAELIIAEQTRDGTTIIKPNVERVKETIASCNLDVMIVDPFISTHRVTENDNNAVDMVAKQWGRIAGEANISCELVHHTVKAALGRETKVEDGRGGGALLYAVRSARVLNTMSEQEAEAGGVEKARRRYYFRVDNGKANLAPPPAGSTWFRFVGVELDNAEGPLKPGDNIGVPVRWEWPEGVSMGADGPTPNRKPKFATQKLLEAFGRCLDASLGVQAPLVPGVQPGALAVADGELRKMATRIGLVTEDRPEDPSAVGKWQAAARQAWKTGTEQAQELRLLRFENGFWWDIRRAGEGRVQARNARD